MTSAEFKPGDVVHLKSGSVNMTISRIEGDDVHVTWMDGSKLNHDVFNKVMLMPAPKIAHRGPIVL